MKTQIAELSIRYQPIRNLKHNPHNSRTHSLRQVRQIADSIKAFGFTTPILVDQDNTIIAGHGRAKAAEILGISELPTISLENLSPDQLRAYVITDNRLAEKAGWDPSILAIELQHLSSINSDFDITVTGFDIPEIDLLLSPADDKPDPADAFEAAESSEAVSQLCDLWQLGRHRLLCGSALEKESYSRLLGGKRAAVVFCDVPYNTAIDGNVGGRGSIHHREFPMASGEMSRIRVHLIS